MDENIFLTSSKVHMSGLALMHTKSDFGLAMFYSFHILIGYNTYLFSGILILILNEP